MSDTIYSRPSVQFFSEVENLPTGLVGTLHVQVIRKADGAAVIARTTAGITESPALSGRYVFAAPAPAAAGPYTVLWDRGTVAPGETAADDLVVTASGAVEFEGEPGRILTLEQYKALRGISSANHDQAIQFALPGAEDAVVRYSQRAFTTIPVTETRSFVYEGQPIVEIADATAVTAVSFNGQSVDAASFILGPDDDLDVFYWIEFLDSGPLYDPFVTPFLINSNPGRIGRRKRLIEVTATWGWPTIPPSVGQAVAWLVDDFAEEEAQGQGVTAEAIADYSRVWSNDETRNEPPILPPRVRQILDPFRRVLL